MPNKQGEGIFKSHLHAYPFFESASTTWSEDYALLMLTMNEEGVPMLASS
jgi:hypothetical protein